MQEILATSNDSAHQRHRRANRDSVSIATAHDNVSGSQFLAQQQRYSAIQLS
jgi:hypothetical protein